ncbi:MAG: diacylglycerol kinase family lipid kinase [bacterium]|nr:diacylglycerol kinase family lipid kinase [bacterium]
MRKKFLIIHNKMAGRLKAPVLARVSKQLERQGALFMLKAASSVQEDIDLARAAVASHEVDAVIAAGGDSTIRGVAMGLMGSNMPLGIIPAGTGNVLAQEIELGHKPKKIAQTLINGLVKTITPGLANGEPFLLMAGAGFDAQIVKNLDHNLKQRIRKAAYIGPTLKALAAKPQRLVIEFPDDQGHVAKSYEASFVVVTKVRLYGGSFILAPEAELTKNDLHVVMFMNPGRFGLIKALICLALGRNAHVHAQVMEGGKAVGQMMKNRGIMIRPCQKVRIKSNEPVPTQIDGEWLAATPLDISTSDAPIQLIVPQTS